MTKIDKYKNNIVSRVERMIQATKNDAIRLKMDDNDAFEALLSILKETYGTDSLTQIVEQN